MFALILRPNEPIGIAYKEAVASGIFISLESIETIKSFNKIFDIGENNAGLSSIYWTNMERT